MYNGSHSVLHVDMNIYIYYIRVVLTLVQHSTFLASLARYILTTICMYIIANSFKEPARIPA
jgi:hypothetical protein